MPNSRVNKGKRGEREAAALLGEMLDTKVIVAVHDKAADIQALPGLAVEVKRQETLNLGGWWRQTCRQADIDGDIPVLIWRQNRKPWRFGLPGYLLTGQTSDKSMMEVSRETFQRWLIAWLS